MNNETIYKVYFKDADTDEESLIFETASKERACYGADMNFESLSSKGSIYVKVDDEIIHTSSSSPDA